MSHEPVTSSSDEELGQAALLGFHDGMRLGRTFLSCVEVGMAADEIDDHLGVLHPDVINMLGDEHSDTGKDDRWGSYVTGLQDGFSNFATSFVCVLDGDAAEEARRDLFEKVARQIPTVTEGLNRDNLPYSLRFSGFYSAAQRIFRTSSTGEPICYKCGLTVPEVNGKWDACSIQFYGGWGSRFGDGNKVASVLCGDCARELVPEHRPPDEYVLAGSVSKNPEDTMDSPTEEYLCDDPDDIEGTGGQGGMSPLREARARKIKSQ